MKYEVTITLKPSMYKYDCAKQAELTGDIILSIFCGYKSTIVTELTQDHNVHYHCMIEIEGIKARDCFLNRFRKYARFFGRKSCQQVQYEESYCEYMKKDINETKKLIKHVVLMDDFDILNKKFQEIDKPKEVDPDMLSEIDDIKLNGFVD